MLRKRNKQKPRLPTLEEMLQFRPARGEFPWELTEEGLVRITVPKFESSFGKSFCQFIRKGDTFTANLDKIGSAVWKHCDGRRTVKEILAILKKEFPKEQNIDQRLFLFLQQMGQLNYLYY